MTHWFLRGYEGGRLLAEGVGTSRVLQDRPGIQVRAENCAVTRSGMVSEILVIFGHDLIASVSVDADRNFNVIEGGTADLSASLTFSRDSFVIDPPGREPIRQIAVFEEAADGD